MLRLHGGHGEQFTSAMECLTIHIEVLLPWPLKNFFREVFKLFECYVLVKKFDRKRAILSNILKIGFFNTLL